MQKILIMTLMKTLQWGMLLILVVLRNMTELYLSKPLSIFQNLKKVIQNYNKLLTKNGLLFISSPNRLITSPNCRELSDKPKNKFHTQEFTIPELTNFVNNFGFQVLIHIIKENNLK